MNEIEEKIKIMDIVERILYFSDKSQDQQRKGLKILTPSQILSSLTISIAQLNAEKILKRL